MPLYRQSQIFARQNVEIDRSTLANWVGGACWWLEPLQARLAEHVFASQKLFADDTPIPVLDPGRGRTKTGPLTSGSPKTLVKDVVVDNKSIPSRVNCERFLESFVECVKVKPCLRGDLGRILINRI